MEIENIHRSLGQKKPLVRVGEEATVSVREYPGRAFPGKITRAAGALDPSSRTMLTEIEGNYGADLGVAEGIDADDRVISNPSERLAEGLEVEVVTPAPPASAIPAASATEGKNRMLRPRLWPFLVALLATTSCAEGSANFHVLYEPGFVSGPTTISVLGVFHEGRMNRETWAQIGPPLSAKLGQRACEVAYGDKLGAEDPELYATIDESVKSEGVTEELLTRLAPSAQGDLILVVSLSGHTTISSGIEDGSPPVGGRVPQPGSGSRLRTNSAPGGPQGRGAELPQIEISGTLFSARSHHRVARLHMAYVGSNLREAIGRFVRRIDEMVPGSSCRGWRWKSAENP